MLRAVVDCNARYLWTDAFGTIGIDCYRLTFPFETLCSEFAFSKCTLSTHAINESQCKNMLAVRAAIKTWLVLLWSRWQAAK